MKGHKWGDAEKKRTAALQMWKNGMSYVDIGKRLGITQVTARKYVEAAKSAEPKSDLAADLDLWNTWVDAVNRILEYAGRDLMPQYQAGK